MMKVTYVPKFGTSQGIIFASNKSFKTQKQDEVELSTNKKDDVEGQKKSKIAEFFKKTKMALAIIGSSLMTALAVFAVTSKKTEGVKKENEKLQEKNAILQAKNEKLVKQFDKIVLPENIESEVTKKINELDGRKLLYSPTQRIGKEKTKTSRYEEDKVALPEKYQKTTLRSDAKELNYPVFKEGKPYSFEFPTSKEVKITHSSQNVVPQPRTVTTVSEAYADSLLWDDNKIARDLLQNFYDGHGQTLDGVKFNVVPTEDGKYSVKIEGKSTFTADKAILLGESSKKNDNKAAGNYGEGLKMVVLKLLREKGAEEVNIASNNWKVNWNFQDSGLGKKVLAYQLDEIKPIDGNYIEFKTDNVDFIKAMVNSFDRFYHYNNPAFKCPDFENDTVGIKLNDKEEKGHFYIAGQAFEVDGDYEALNKMNIYIKKKPPVRHNGALIFDPSRDRTSLTYDNLEALGQWVASSENLSKEEAVKLIHSLEEYWDVGTSSAFMKHNTKGTPFINGIFKGLYYRSDVHIKFADKNVTDSYRVSSELGQMYQKAGYRICNSYLHSLGMRSIDELVEETRKHTPLEPTPTEKNKILILQDAIKLLSPILKENDFFTEDELDAKILIFDRKASNEDKSYETVTGEAIIEDRKTLGFWLDRNALKESDFATMLSVSLHELTHKFGGDSSETFSYKLTDVLEKVFAAINENPNLAIQLKVLEKAWEAQK